MAYVVNETGRDLNAGRFLESEVGVVRKTRQIPASMGTDIGDSKVVLAGTPFPANDATAEGFVYEDVDVTYGDAAGSVVVAGRVYTDQLPVTPESAAVTALSSTGFVFVETKPAVERPY